MLTKLASNLQQPEQLDTYSSPGNLFYYFIIVGVTIFLAYFAAKLVAQKLGSRQSRGEWFTVLDIHMLSRDRRLLLVKLGQSIVVLTENSTGMQLIKEFSEEESREIVRSLATEVGVNGLQQFGQTKAKFSNILLDQLEKMWKRDKDSE